MGQQKIYLVWKTTLLLNAGLLVSVVCQQWNSLSLCVLLFVFNLIYILPARVISAYKRRIKIRSHNICPICIASVGVSVWLNLVSKECVFFFFFWVALNNQNSQRMDTFTRSHTHGNLTLDTWSSVIQAGHQSFMTVTCRWMRQLRIHLVALMPLHTCHCAKETAKHIQRKGLFTSRFWFLAPFDREITGYSLL